MVTTNLTPDDATTVERIARELSTKPGPLIEVLHAVQHAFGYVPQGAIPLIASQLNLSRAEVHGVVTFYHHFRNTPPGARTIQVCRAEACQAMRGEALEAHVKEVLGIGYHETTADNRFSLEPVYCLGNCACAPSIMIGNDLHGRVTPAVFDELLSDAGSTS